MGLEQRKLVGWLTGVWTMALGAELLRLPTLGSFVVLDLVVRAVIWLVALWLTFSLARDLRAPTLRWAIPLAGALAVVVFFNWSVLSPRWWFETHRLFYDAAVASSMNGREADGHLPLYLRWLSADGNVTASCLACDESEPAAPLPAFFPQWYGSPDDAGGYVYSPDREPEGMDMSGMTCQDPVDLGSGWWMCGM